MSPLEILGISSAFLALTAFIASQYHFLTSESFLYDFLNLLSGVGLFIYAYHIGVLPFMLTNGVWALVSGLDVVRYLWKKL